MPTVLKSIATFRIPLKNTANEEGGVTDNYSRRTVGAVLDEIERNLTLSVALLDGWERGGKYMINKTLLKVFWLAIT